MGTDEQADWAAALGCDPGAFARIFDRHRDAVFRQALRLLELPADAEEVASVAFFELWRKRDRVVPVAGSVRPWLLVTTANLARNSHRVRVRREQFLRRLTDEHRPDGGADAFERVDDGVLRQELAAGLRQLKPQDVALVTMTARVVGVPASCTGASIPSWSNSGSRWRCVVVVVLVGLRARRRTRGSRTGSAVAVIAVVVAILPVIARLVGASATVDDVLALAPIGAYVLFGVYWLLRNHRDVVAGWKAETEDDRRRGLR